MLTPNLLFPETDRPLPQNRRGPRLGFVPLRSRGREGAQAGSYGRKFDRTALYRNSMPFYEVGESCFRVFAAPFWTFLASRWRGKCNASLAHANWGKRGREKRTPQRDSDLFFDLLFDARETHRAEKTFSSTFRLVGRGLTRSDCPDSARTSQIGSYYVRGARVGSRKLCSGNRAAGATFSFRSR